MRPRPPSIRPVLWSLRLSIISWALLAGPAVAEEAEIPAGVQAQLVSKIPSYDHGFKQRAGKLVVVLILTLEDNPESVRAATLLHAALGREPAIAGLPHTASIYAFTDVGALVAEATRRSASIVYLTTGVSEQLESICAALEPLGMLTMTTVPDYVRRCVIVGFQLLGGRPKILIHLEHAESSGIRFRSALLELSKVYR